MDPQAGSPVSPKPILPQLGGTASSHTTNARKASYSVSCAVGTRSLKGNILIIRVKTSSRSADPMSLSRIISESDNDRAAPIPRPVSRSPSGTKSSRKYDAPVKKEIDIQPPLQEPPARLEKIAPAKNHKSRSVENGVSVISDVKAGNVIERPSSPTEKEIEAAMLKIENMASPDANAPGLEKYRLEWKERTRKRVRDVEAKENYRRKVSCTIAILDATYMYDGLINSSADERLN